MSPSNRGQYPDPDQWPYRSSDTWLLVDAIITLLAAIITIVVIILRHPFILLAGLIMLGVVAALAGWR